MKGSPFKNNTLFKTMFYFPVRVKCFCLLILLSFQYCISYCVVTKAVSTQAETNTWMTSKTSISRYSYMYAMITVYYCNKENVVLVYRRADIKRQFRYVHCQRKLRRQYVYVLTLRWRQSPYFLALATKWTCLF